MKTVEISNTNICGLMMTELLLPHSESCSTHVNLSQQVLEVSTLYFKRYCPSHVLIFNPLNAELNPIRHLLALVGVRHIVHVSRIRVNTLYTKSL